MEDKKIICKDCGKEFIFTVGEQEFFKEKGFEIVSSYLNTDNYYNTVNYKDKVALIIGNEANGVNDELIKGSDTLVKIPIYGNAESLNAAISSAILMYEIKKSLV